MKHDEVEKHDGKSVVPSLAAKRRLDWDGFPLQMNVLRIAVSHACSVIGETARRTKGKTK